MVSLLVGRDVRADQEQLAAAGDGVGLADVAAAVAQRLDLGSGQREAGLDPFEDMKVVPRLAVLGDQFSGCVSHCSRSLCRGRFESAQPLGQDEQPARDHQQQRAQREPDRVALVLDQR